MRKVELRWLADIPESHERFQAAIRARGLNEAAVKQIERATTMRFTLWFVLFTLGLGYIIAALGGGALAARGVPMVMPIIWSASFLLFLGAKTARASFELYQLKTRSLAPFSEWLRNPAAWLGSGFVKGGAKLLALLAVGAAVARPELAFADGTSTPSAGTAMSWLTQTLNAQDLSLQWISHLFPGGITTTQATTAGVTPSTDTFTPLFTAFNSIIMAIGSGMLAWHTISGAVATAHEGKVLGQKWHTIWAPIRLCIGAASVAPVTGGYCAAQLLAIQILIMGYGFADGMWSTYINAVLGSSSGSGSQHVLVNTPGVSISQDTLKNVIIAEVCANIVSHDTDTFTQASGGWFSWMRPGSTNRAPGITTPKATINPTDGSIIWDYGAICGTLKIPPLVPPSTTTTTPVNTTQTTVTLADGTTYNLPPGANPTTFDTSTLTGQQVATAYAGFQAKRQKDFEDFLSAVRGTSLITSLSSAISSGLQSATASPSGTPMDWQSAFTTIQQAASTYAQAITNDAAVYSQAMNTQAVTAFKNQALNMGWAGAGSLNAAIVQLSKVALDEAISSEPSFSGQDLSSFSDTAKKKISSVNELVAAFIQTASAAAATNGSISVTGVSALASMSANGGVSSNDVITSVFGSSMNKFAAWSANRVAGPVDSINPMGSIMANGQELLIVGEGIFASYALLNATVYGAEKGPGESWLSRATGGAFGGVVAFLSKMVETAGSIVIPVSISFMIVGVIQSVVVPMVPFIIWFYAMISCAGFAVAFVIAAPLAAFMHIRMDGDELIGNQQQPFYSTLFQGALRPSLLLLGLIASNKVFGVMATFLNQTMNAAMLSSQGSQTMGIMMTIGFMILSAYIEYQLATHSMEMITKVPSMVAEMLGVRDIGGDEHRQGSQVSGAVVGLSNTHMTSGLSQATQAMGRKPQPKDDSTDRIVKAIEGGKGGGGGNGPKAPSGPGGGGGSGVTP